MLRWILCALAGLSLCFVSIGEASADRVKKLTVQLAKSRSAKVRSSAALSLAKTDDARALAALTKSLRRDKSAAIRRISAASLGQRLQSMVSVKSRKKVVSALKKASKSDRDSKVRSSAKVALAKAKLPAANSGGKTRGIMVRVAAPTKVSKRLPRQTAALLQSRVRQVIKEESPPSVRTAPGTGMPSTSQLKRSGMAGYSVVPNISKLKLKRKGRRAFVTCEIKMRLSPWRGVGGKLAVGKSATVTGLGTVSSKASKRAISDSSQACIEAVVTQVTANQVVPFLVAQAR
ncbi:MAG: HEAT repeat domain-containing protein [Myxococcales bacterium]|nr:HEAT repeat domain-containing protein [Myxococcales bacterium]